MAAVMLAVGCTPSSDGSADSASADVPQLQTRPRGGRARTSGPDSSSLMAWWDRRSQGISTGQQEPHSFDDMPNGIVARHIKMTELVSPATGSLSAPRGMKSRTSKLLLVHESSSYRIVLHVPTDSFTTEPDGWCDDNMAILAAGQGMPSVEVDLNPYCGGPESFYFDSEVNFVLYWLPGYRLPFLEMSTNGPECVPVYFYRFDDSLNQYEQVRGRPECEKTRAR